MIALHDKQSICEQGRCTKLGETLGMPDSLATIVTGESLRLGVYAARSMLWYRESDTHLGTRRMMAARTPVTDRSTKIQPSMNTAASAVAYGNCNTTRSRVLFPLSHAISLQDRGTLICILAYAEVAVCSVLRRSRTWQHHDEAGLHGMTTVQEVAGTSPGRGSSLDEA